MNSFYSKQDERGQALVEFSLILPLLLLLIFGIIQFGIIFSCYILVNSASKEAVRISAVTDLNDTDHEAINKITQITSPFPFLNIKSIDISPEPSARIQGEDVMVMIDASVGLIVPLVLNEEIDFPIISARMRYEPHSLIIEGSEEFVLEELSLNQSGDKLRVSVELLDGAGNPIGDALIYLEIDYEGTVIEGGAFTLTTNTNHGKDQEVVDFNNNNKGTYTVTLYSITTSDGTIYEQIYTDSVYVK
ncbi:MAG: hypothetical protein APF76_07755 [Desulfitibacter sp. BRH_c19]|nr:MAG: hypothetical protein APF76_07755 [Desulfitibacter sp. BRH_c19]